MERLMMKVQEWLDDYSEWLAERPLAAPYAWPILLMCVALVTWLVFFV